MAQKSAIEWTHSTWNPVRGCSKVSPGCKNCYAETFAERWRGVKDHPYEQGFDLKLIPEKLEEPLRWKTPRTIFVNSMSDLFHEDIPLKYIKRVFDVLKRAHWHTFQILTKRSERLVELAPELPWPQNVWQGVSVESQSYVDRVRDLCTVPAAVRFLSLEPLLSAIPALPLDGVDWVIVGGESGRRCRPMKAQWARDIRDQCVRENVPFFFKQWGGTRPKANGRLLDDRTWDEMPAEPGEREEASA